jgi:hypothetical protein
MRLALLLPSFLHLCPLILLPRPFSSSAPLLLPPLTPSPHSVIFFASVSKPPTSTSFAS